MLAVPPFSPLVSESYMAREMEVLAEEGLDVAFAVSHPGVAPAPLPAPALEGSLDDAVRRFDPDALFVYWAVTARDMFVELAEVALPFAVRVHSFDFDPGLVRALSAHPFCFGVWGYPHQADEVPTLHPLPSLFSRASEVPLATRRDLVLSLSAALPKKDVPLLVDAFACMKRVDRRIVMGMTNGFEDLPREVFNEVLRHPSPPLVQLNLTREQVAVLLDRTSVVVYTLSPGETRLGEPSAIVEGLLAGAFVVVPDHPHLRAVAGPHARVYRTAADIVAHVDEITEAGTGLDALRQENRDWALERYCDDGARRAFVGALLDELDRWQTGISAARLVNPPR